MDPTISSTEHVFTPECPECCGVVRVAFRTRGDGPDVETYQRVLCLTCAATFVVTIGINPPRVSSALQRVIVNAPSTPDPLRCPARVKSSIDAYCELGLPPGDFVRSVLANDLYGAVTRADDVNLPALPHVVAYVVKRVPASLCGSMAAVNNHIDRKADERRKQGRPDVRDEVQS